MPDKPWVMRTYSGHSSARASNELYRTNLAKGQTGLSIAFDLPTQTGYDPDAPEAKGEVGKVGVPVTHLGHMRQLMDGIPLGEMNTSMTINATAAWLLGLYIAYGTEQGVDPTLLSGTTQNDIVKEYLSRGTYIFPPEPSRRLIADMVAYTVKHVPKWNPINVCSYHLQEAGATPVQELAYALATAIGVLDAVRESGQVTPDDFPQVVGRISFFCNAGIRFVEETCKMRAFTKMWDRICAERYGVTDPKLRRFRYGVQVNSLGLTEAQPENNVQRIVLETLGVALSKDARARAIQLPAWNEALGLPRPWDQQWSLRIQQVLAFETDLLEYDDIFEGSKVIETRTDELIGAAQAELDEVLELGGAFEAIEEIKGRLVKSETERTRRIEAGDLTVVGVNAFTQSAPSPLAGEEVILRVDPAVETEQRDDVAEWRAARDDAAVVKALDQLRAAASSNENVMPATIALAHAGGTTGEWAGSLREVFGEYRAPTGVSAAVGTRRDGLAALAERMKELPGGPPRLLVAKPGLDGHSNGAEQIAVAARDAGMEVVYQGIRLTPSEIAAVARDEDVDVVGISILSGSHLELVPEVLRLLGEQGVDAAVVVGGIIPAEDQAKLESLGVAAVYTPKDFQLTRMMEEIAALAESRRGGVAREFQLDSAPGMADGQFMDRRALVGLGSGAAGLALGASAVAFGSAVVGVIAAVFALGAAAACVLVVSRLREKDAAADGLRREILQLEDALLAEREAFESTAELASPTEPPGASTVRDAETGLLGEHYFELALEHRIATARRQLQPVALLLLSLDSPEGPGHEDRQQRAVYAFAEILRDTLRESDTVCRLSATNFGIILEDTSEAGGVWAAERLRTALVREGVASARLAAGVAAYPTHALESGDVLTRAAGALDSARQSGSSRVEVASAD